MPIEEPSNVLKALFYIDERNLWCLPCARRLAAPDNPETEFAAYKGPTRECTEYKSFARGDHPDMFSTVRTAQELREKLDAIAALPALEDQYDAGHADGAHQVLMWVLGDAETFDVSE